MIVSAAIKVEHFEIASYRGLITGAEQMGQQKVVNLLKQNLREEEQTALIAEQRASGLIQKAMRVQQQGQQQEEQEEEKGLIDKAKDKLMGQ